MAGFLEVEFGVKGSGGAVGGADFQEPLAGVEGEGGLEEAFG